MLPYEPKPGPTRLAQIFTLMLFCAIFACVIAVAHCQSFYAAGISLLPQSSPKPTGWAAAIVTVNANQKVYSISEVDFTVVKNGALYNVQTAARTGIATWLRAFGPVNLYGLADAGAATSGTTSSGAFAGGGMLVFPINKQIGGTVGARVLKTNLGSQVIAEMGIVFGGGK